MVQHLKITDLTSSLSASPFLSVSHEEMENVFPMHTPMIFDGVCIGICTKGNVQVQVGYHLCSLSFGSVLVIPARQITSIVSRSEELWMDFLFLPVSFWEELPLPTDFDLLRIVYEYPHIEMKEEDFSVLQELYILIRRHTDALFTPYRKEMVQALVLAFAARIASEYYTCFLQDNMKGSKISSRAGELTYRFFTLLGEQYMYRKELGYYAGQLCVTSKYLTSVVRKVTGKSASEWMHQTLLTDIKQRLKNTNVPVGTLSEIMHFSDPSSFSRYFKQQVGCTPLEYRNRSSLR